jgi:tetratricopeptide (TPR) repeat protein
VTLAQNTLDDLWDFSDAAGSEQRIRAALATSTDAAETRELRTQLARALGLQERFTEAHGMLDALDLDDPAVAVRYSLERGRLHNSAGAAVEAARHFRRAAELAAPPAAAELTFLRIDALHMLAIAEPEGAEDHTAQAVQELADVDDPRTLRWLVGLHNNLGWHRFDAGDAAGALDEFEASMDAAERYGTPAQVAMAAEAIAEARAAAGETG